MEEMDTSFTLFGQNLSTVHEIISDEMSPPLTTIRHRSRIALQFRCDEPRDVFMGHLPMSLDESLKPNPLDELQHEDETMSSYGRELGRRSKRVAFTSSKSRMSAVKKRSKICFERINEATTPPLQGSGRQLRRNLFDSDVNDESDVALVKPLKSIQFGTTACDTTDVSYRHSSRASSSSLVWKKHSSLPEPSQHSQSCAAKFPKCHSDAELLITSALSRSSDDHDLIGDYSRPFRLPVISGKHQDLKSISHETMAMVLSGRCSSLVGEYIVVDCRYPYEYEAGHITGARNIYSKDEIISQFLSSPPSIQFLQKNPILIFHCEFSSERGPKLLRYLRNRDRSMHQENYPALYYPEMYILEGGYKEFCQWHMDLCEPRGYKPMVHKDHANELAYYQSKSRLYTSKLSSQASEDVAATNDRTEKQKFTSLRC